MRAAFVWFIVFLCSSPSLLLVSAAYAQGDVDCAVVKKDLRFKRQQLAEHIDALKKLNEQNELVIMGLLTHKIDELIEEIRKLEEKGSDCLSPEPAKAASGLDSVKSDQGEFATKSCDELRKALFQLLQKSSALKRREDSLFSPLTAAEKRELHDSEQALTEVKAAIKARCSPQAAPRLFERLRR